VLDDPEIKVKYPYVEKVKASFENLKPRPVSPFYSQMSVDAIQPNFGAAMARAKTPEQAIRDMAEKLRQIVKG
jgi:multiple sugar transport system substrate-binding protein